MRVWEAGSLVCSVYLTITALVRGGRQGARRRALIAAAAGLLLSAASAGMKEIPILHAWLLPPILLLTAFRGSDGEIR